MRLFLRKGCLAVVASAGGVGGGVADIVAATDAAAPGRTYRRVANRTLYRRVQCINALADGSPRAHQRINNYITEAHCYARANSYALAKDTCSTRSRSTYARFDRMVWQQPSCVCICINLRMICTRGWSCSEYQRKKYEYNTIRIIRRTKNETKFVINATDPFLFSNGRGEWAPLCHGIPCSRFEFSMNSCYIIINFGWKPSIF